MGGMGTSTQKSTENSQTTYPQWTQDAYQDTYGVGSGMLENFLRNPQYAVAGMNTDQMKGFDLARDSARNIFTNPASVAPGSPMLNPVNASAAEMSAASVDASMNPHIQNVVDTTRNTMTRDWRDKDASLAAASAASAVRGSGGALARGQLARGAQENIGSITAQLMSQGYDKMKAMELANAQMQQQANQSNAGFQQQTALANAGAANSMLTTGADYGLKAAQVNDQFRTNQQARELAALQQILQGGNQQQKFAQTALDVPWTALERLFGLTPKQLNSQTISQKEGESTKSPMDTISGGIGALTGLKTLFGGCDRSLKTDIEEIGRDEESGLPIYAFRYKSDPKTYPKAIGPMADEVEARYPGSTTLIAGKRVIIMSAVPASLFGGLGQ